MPPSAVPSHRSTPPIRNPAVVVAAALSALVCALSVVGLADAATEHEGPAVWDRIVAGVVVADRTRPLSVLAEVISSWGSATGVLVTALLVVAAAAWTQRGRTLLGGPVTAASWIVLTLAGSAAMTVVVKTVVARQRPPAWMELGPPDTDFAFPSGHTLNSTTLFLTVAGLVAWRLVRRRDRLIVVGLAAAAAVAVGLSRIYLGYHWLTDVLAGWLLALAWLSVLVSAFAWWSGRRRAGDASR